ncbi:hypothetical protein BN938_1197 [Mucinivorans hirudinis]|uniref:Uncharacterized protein n=1 Tax=Mucinivorans hirudinis TaxID=1433126 RepID=A0A060R7L9_9BACT|nr:hypothetical protein BN938_1197 [Mucinivorans hirudinis]
MLHYSLGFSSASFINSALNNFDYSHITHYGPNNRNQNLLAKNAKITNG